MNAVEYAAKRAAGICTWGACRRKSRLGVLCKDHRRRHRDVSNRCHRARYVEKKVAGICVTKSCTSASREDAVFCEPCTKKHTEERRRFTSSEKGRKWHRRYQARRRKDRADRGLCLRCDTPRVTKTLCDEHRREALARWRKRTGKGPNLNEHCSACGGAGHRVTTCKGLPALPPLRIEDFASARQEAA